ncbi:MAG: hypothetical protein CVV33_01775 [Methanomicrobiales archaeon HGW-Methanomicrobiales-4]|nr:MAG: hypothetical protein CVV33_01775 [Methanomicrobiales archaeon HGW-Methanomicrobiales-4]
MEDQVIPAGKNNGVFQGWAAAQKNSDLSRFFENIILNAKLWMMFLDTGRNVVIWNKAAGEISGYSGDEVLGNNTIWRLIYPDAGYRRTVTEKILESIKENKILDNFETTIRTKNGDAKKISWNTREFFWDDGESAGFIVIGDDITAIAEAKTVIHRYAEFQKSVIVNAKLWMTFLDIQNNVVIWNKAAEEITGYSRDEVVGRDEVWRWLYPDIQYRRDVTRKIKDILRNNKELENFETKILTKNGITRDISWNTRELNGEDGICIGYIIVGNDITEKVLAKKEIKESEELFHGIATGASDAIALLDENGIIRYWNPAAEKLFGMSSDNALNTNFFSLFSSLQSRDKNQTDFRTFFESQKGPFIKSPCLLSMQNNSGEILNLEMSLASLQFKGMWNALGIFRDITGRIEAEHREREMLLNALLQGSPIPQFMIDKNHAVVFWNRALEEYSGMKAADVIGSDQHWRAFYEEKRPCMADLLVDNAIDAINQWYGKKSSKSQLVEDAYEATDFFPKMGKTGKWLYFTAAVIRNSEGNVIGVLETLEDITDTMLYNPR